MTMTSIPSMRAPAAKNTYDVIPDGDYPARVVRFIGLGIHEPKPFKGQVKDPAFKCAMQFELIGIDATGKDGEGKPLEPRPACQFKDMFLYPNAKRGGVFDFCRTIDPSLQKSPNNLEWFIENLGAIVSVTVGHYIGGDGKPRNCINNISAIPSMFKSQVGPARSELVGFNPYVDTPEMMGAYSKLFKFQRDIIAEAHDRADIPFAGKEPAQQEQGFGSAPAKPAVTTATATASEPSMDYDSDCPF